MLKLNHNSTRRVDLALSTMTPSTADLVVTFVIAFFCIVGLALFLRKFIPDCRKKCKGQGLRIEAGVESDVESGRCIIAFLRLRKRIPQLLIGLSKQSQFRKLFKNSVIRYDRSISFVVVAYRSQVMSRDVLPKSDEVGAKPGLLSFKGNCFA